MKFRLSDKARRDLVRILLEGSQQFGVPQAAKYRDGLWKTFELLERFPLIGVERDEVVDGLRSHPFQSHVVLYRVTDELVDIVRVRHGREDWQSGLD